MLDSLTLLSAETSNLRLEEVDLIFTYGRNPVVVDREMAQRSKAGLPVTTILGNEDGKNGNVLEVEEKDIV